MRFKPKNISTKNTLYTIAIVGFLSPFLILGFFLQAYTYDISSLINYNPKQTTRIYDKDGNKIANLFDKKHRYYVPFEKIPPHVVEALVAIEDTSFFEHPGINIDAIFRAAIKVLKAGRAVEGASTITQQLVKNVLLTREKKLSRKIKEAIYALKLERHLTKEQILERYLNEIYFGHGYYGIKTAADGYFHKRMDELTLKEIAVLVGLPKAPTTYAPTRNYEISMGRANRVLKRMYTLGWLDKNTYEEEIASTPKVYDDTLTQNKAPFIVDEVVRRMKKRGMDDIKTGGYDVYTSVDLRMQEAARDSVKKAYDLALQRIEDYKVRDQEILAKDPTWEVAPETNTTLLNGALVSLEAKTGNILAMVGSIDYTKSSYNRATQGRRQPGSAFKPFIYQVAIDLGFSGATKLVDVSRTYKYEKDGEELKWKPRNYEKNYKGLISLREALVHSRNLATINLVNEIGLHDLLTQLDKFGIKNLPRDLSVALGTISLSPLQLARYYSSFANKGIQVKPSMILSIKKNDETVYEKHLQTRFITEPTQSFIMTSILRDVVKRGTGRRAKAWGIELAGKTGTTNNNVDGWFAGYSPTIQTIVWFGNDDNSPMHRWETGGKVAAPAFKMFYDKILKLYPQIKRKFDVPDGIVEVKVGRKKEYFSDISKPPRVEQDVKATEELLF